MAARAMSAQLPSPSTAATFDMVAMASSAGGLAALAKVLSGLPASFPAPVLLVQHLDPRHKSQLAEILARRTPLQVVQADDGQEPVGGTVYIAPPDRHLLVNPDRRIHLSQSELVHFLRPSADLLFESVAAVYGPRAIAVVLTGTGSDGSLGVEAIKQRGGRVIAQDRETSEFFGMPGSAIRTGAPDYVLPLDAIAGLLEDLVAGGAA
jgi:two-component system chemotaxis response regulator CheB